MNDNNKNDKSKDLIRYPKAYYTIGSHRMRNPTMSITIRMIVLEIAACKSDLAPISSKITHREIPTDDGKPRKNEFNRLPTP